MKLIIDEMYNANGNYLRKLKREIEKRDGNKQQKILTTQIYSKVRSGWLFTEPQSKETMNFYKENGLSGNDLLFK